MQIGHTAEQVTLTVTGLGKYVITKCCTKKKTFLPIYQEHD